MIGRLCGWMHYRSCRMSRLWLSCGRKRLHNHPAHIFLLSHLRLYLGNARLLSLYLCKFLFLYLDGNFLFAGFHAPLHFLFIAKQFHLDGPSYINGDHLFLETHFLLCSRIRWHAHAPHKQGKYQNPCCSFNT